MPRPAPPRGRTPAPSRARKPDHAPGRPPARPGAGPGSHAGGEEPRKLFRVAGLPAVSALFEHEPARVERLFFEERFKPQAGAFCKALAAARKPYRMVDAEELSKVAGTVLHGGIVALIAPRPVPAFDTEAARRWAAEDGQPLLILDGVGNPHNLGAILRTAAFFGLRRLVVSGHPGQALPSEAAYRVAEGGFEWVELYQATDLPLALKRLRGTYRTVGTALGQGRQVTDVAGLAKGAKPAAVILGNEEEGIPAATLAACEEIVTIPGSGLVQSLNVAATAAIIIHALAAGR
ncbi:RNA methyltransferase [Azospirillum sp. SYSU D00513]|uniref:TrmH family RNA methyltransferase n=1 Tax=Azospirillum sp. SYSU D00513 TaxID=2812561 RepID=UPI001A9628A3|nr:RNA methyltransferase [Azospirillum sp. SYSU D00513]